MALSKARQKWIDIAKTRIINILKRYLIANVRTLEAKISEAGPNSQRAEPQFITIAKKSLCKEGRIQKIKDVPPNLPDTYALPKFSEKNPQHKKRLKKIIDLSEQFRSITSDKVEDCGRVLEKVTYNSVLDCEGIDIMGRPNDPPKYFNNQQIHDELEPEFILLYPTIIEDNKAQNLPAFIECKNNRRWIYPQSPKVWNMLYKAAKLEMVPILVARRFGYTTRYLFQNIGVLGFETYFQYFSPGLEEEMKDIVHKEGLGFHTTRFSEEKEKRFTKFFDKTVRRQIITLYDKFTSLKPHIIEISEKLKREDISGSERKDFYYEEVYKHFIKPELQEQPPRF